MGAVEVGCPAKSASRQGCSRAGDDIAEPADASPSKTQRSGSRARSSRAPEKHNSDCEDDNGSYHDGIRQVINQFESVSAQAFRQGFNHFHIHEVAYHQEQVTLGPDEIHYGLGHSENASQADVDATALCHQAKGWSSEGSTGQWSQRCSNSASADERRRGKSDMESCSSNKSTESERHIESCSSDNSMEW